jgi:P-type Ca2+ transporter type 2C
LITAGVIAGLVLVLYVPLLRDLFSFATPNPLELLLCVAAALISILWFEIAKLVRKVRK